ncbi:response regulator transcription factor [Paenibacillus sp. FA6]|uniref:response regulator transcription factor n=1 Tax=Paenibacillus sp. FA6 TaxID=3413029 RepID=UPI003F659645
MIRVIVVDDDKLVRKGLISAMPWDDFGMEVVGEASNGEKALEFLAENEVDLMLTDLSMPVMSGIDLMRIARKKYPHTHIVVLTLHQDFEYIQEAMRLGAIDYIAKVQLEKERFEEVLGRIHNRIMEQDQLSNKNNKGQRDRQDDEVFSIDHGYVLISMNRVSASNRVRNWVSSYNGSLKELGLNLFFCLPPSSSEGERLFESLEKEMDACSDWAMIKLSGIVNRTTEEVYGWIREYKDKDFFYDYNPTVKVMGKSIGAGESVGEVRAEESMTLLKSNWEALEWIYQDTLYRRNLDELKHLHLPQAKLIGFLYVLVDRWNHLFVKIIPATVQLQDSLDSWQQVEVWIDQTRDHIRHVLGRIEFSPEVIMCIMKAVDLLQEGLEQQITATDIAKRVNMSRSYFSQCFKGIVGDNFNHYLRQARMEKAKHYLLYSNKTISWIANNVGYEDDKYFSRSFREQTGMLPSEYRVIAQEGRDMSANEIE